jgi:hypothetical protein
MTRAMMWSLVALICFTSRPVAGAPQAASGITVDKSSIGGVVVNSNGAKPEAGVWVIAETKSLPAPFRKIVVTDDQGRFLVPDLPDGAYELWVRGYGLKDSEPVKAVRGGKVTLKVANAATPQEAAKIYPASYWTSLIQPPSGSDLPAGTRPRKNGLGTRGTGATTAMNWAWSPRAAIPLLKIGTLSSRALRPCIKNSIFSAKVQ